MDPDLLAPFLVGLSVGALAIMIIYEVKFISPLFQLTKRQQQDIERAMRQTDEALAEGKKAAALAEKALAERDALRAELDGERWKF